MTQPTLRSWPYVALGYLSGALVGGLTVGVIMTLIALSGPLWNSDNVGFGLALVMGVFAAIYAFVAFLAGLLVIGTPAWLFLHGVKRRGVRTAMAAGVVLAGLAGALAGALFGGFWIALLATPAGVTAAFAMHRAAYRRTA